MMIQKRPSHTPRIFRWMNLLLDDYIARIRYILFPLEALYRGIRGLAALFWLGRNEYLKTRFGACGRGVRIYGRLQLTGACGLEVGANVHINTGAFLRAEGGLTIGDNTHISRNLLVYTFNHDYQGERLPYDEVKVHKPVHIGRNVWIGMNVCITPGVTIGDGAIIGLGTVVAKDVPPLAVVGSAPQTVLKRRDSVHYRHLEASGCYGGMSGYPLNDASPGASRPRPTERGTTGT